MDENEDQNDLLKSSNVNPVMDAAIRDWNRESLARHEGFHEGYRLHDSECRGGERSLLMVALCTLLAALVGMAAGWIARSWLDWNQFQNIFGPTL
tara:strand:+ start:1069 stop:1353 length:285 start_codon:yes stop_codon:yes gene_type:complete